MKKKILFVCVENAGRSQMAEAFARAFGRDKVDAYSAGSKPAGSVNPVVVAAMKDLYLDISANEPKGFDALPVKKFDIIVTMGCGDACPVFPAKERIDWKVDDPKGRDIEDVRRIRDEIKTRVELLIDSVDAKGV